MIEQEMDMSVLEAIHIILRKTKLNLALKEKMTSRVLRAEDDVASGRLLSQEEVILRTQRK